MRPNHPHFLHRRQTRKHRHQCHGSPGQVWAYWVRIDNQGPETVQLRSRYWHITDASGRIQEVRGAGVVGEQPVMQPGQSYEYTSGTPLPTPSGIMLGSYEMESEQGERFEIGIPAFSLDSPYQVKSIN